jgi:hypothetical protein
MLSSAFEKLDDLASGRLGGPVQWALGLAAGRRGEAAERVARFAHEIPAGQTIPGPEPLRCIELDLFDALDDRGRAEVACGLSMLWDGFLERFGSPDQYGGAPEAGRAEYVASLRAMGRRIRETSGPDRVHFAYVPEMMALFATCLGARAKAAPDREAARVIAALIAQGRAARDSGAAAA